MCSFARDDRPLVLVPRRQATRSAGLGTRLGCCGRGLRAGEQLGNRARRRRRAPRPSPGRGRSGRGCPRSRTGSRAGRARPRAAARSARAAPRGRSRGSRRPAARMPRPPRSSRAASPRRRTSGGPADPSRPTRAGSSRARLRAGGGTPRGGSAGRLRRRSVRFMANKKTLQLEGRKSGTGCV